MHYSQRMKQYATNDKRMHHVTSSKDLADHEVCNSSFTASMLHHVGEKSSNNRISKKDCPRTSPLLRTFSKKDLIGCSDVARSDSHTVNETVSDHMNSQYGWQNSRTLLGTSISKSGKKSVDRDARLQRSQDAIVPNWGVRPVPQTTINSHELASNIFFSDQCRPHYASPTNVSQKFRQKGSSSKGPQIHDVSAPLHVEKKYRHNNNNLVYQNEIEQSSSERKYHNLPRSRNMTIVSKRIGQSSSSSGGGDQRGKKKTAIHVHKVRAPDLGQRNKDGNSGHSSCSGLSNFVCSSASDVLPSVSCSTMNGLACASPSDVLASSSSSTNCNGDHVHLRKISKTFVHDGDGETSRGVYLGKEHIENGDLLLSEEQRTRLKNGKSQAENFSSAELEFSRGSRASPCFLQKETRNSRTISSVESGNNVIHTSPSLENRSLPTAYFRRGRGPRFSRNNDDESSSSSPFLQPIPSFGDEVFSSQRDLRRSLYGTQAEVSRPESRIPMRGMDISPSSSSGMRERQYMRSSFSGPPPARPPPLLPLPPFEAFLESSSSLRPSVSALTSDSYFSRMIHSSPSTNQQVILHDSSALETIAFQSSMSPGELNTRFNAESLSEVIFF